MLHGTNFSLNFIPNRYTLFTLGGARQMRKML